MINPLKTLWYDIYWSRRCRTWERFWRCNPFKFEKNCPECQETIKRHAENKKRYERFMASREGIYQIMDAKYGKV